LPGIRRTAIGKLVQLLDVPRSALISAVGSIPYAGGILSSALNFAIGLMVEQLTGLISNEFIKPRSRWPKALRAPSASDLR
jgi:hypothetical protein